MTIKHTALPFTLMFFGALCGSCTNTQTTATNMEKTIIPDSSWTCGMPDGIPKPENGVLVFEAQMNLDKVYEVGKTQYGLRKVFVVKDGTITSDKIQASVIPGGLDFQLTLSNGIIEIEQVLVLLNKGKYAARRTVNLREGTLKMIIYDVSEVVVDASNSVKISKPADVPYQSWDYRKASPSEKQGEQFITETVTLGGSTTVGISKRGMRNIIPITGGTLSGKISGKVLFGGADYQNFTSGPAIDARYLWQADDGEIIIVRNTGPMGSLVPTFEANVDGKYSWLNSGTYLSSNPGMGAGGVRLTMYKSN
ncbi:MAG: DUF3237 family protein [Sedimentisphaerales bacterium]